MMGALEVRAGIIRSYAELGDDAGLAYGLRVITAELKAALGAAGMLAQVTEPERARRRAARTSQPEAREVAL